MSISNAVMLMLPNFSSLQQDLGSEIAAGDRGFGMGFCNGTSWEAGCVWN